MDVTANIIYIYLLVFLPIGYLAYRYEKKRRADEAAESFFLAGRTMRGIVLAMTIIASYYSTFALLGMPGIIYTHGIPFMVMQVSGLTVPPLLWWYVGGRMWSVASKNRLFTVGHILEFQYNTYIVRLIAAFIGLAFAIPFIALQLIGAGLIFETATGGVINFQLGAIITLLFLFAYGAVGGLRGIAWADTIHGTMLFAAMFIGGFVAAFVAFNNPNELFTAVFNERPALFSLAGGIGVFSFISIMAYWIFPPMGMMMNPFLSLRLLSAENPNQYRVSGTYTVLLCTISIAVGSSLVGLAGNVLYPGLTTPDTVFILIISDYANPVLAGLLFAAIIAAAMSTADSNMHGVSTILTHDIYYRLFKKDASKLLQAIVGRVTMVIIGVVALGYAFLYRGHIVILGFLAVGISAQIFPSLFAALFWKKASPLAAILAMISGLGTIIYLRLILGMLLYKTIPVELCALIVNIIVLVLVSYVVPAKIKGGETQAQ